MVEGAQPIMRIRWPQVTAIALLLTTWAVLNARPEHEVSLARKPLAEFPLSLSDQWIGKEVGIDSGILDVLKLSDYMMRVYVPTQLESGGGLPQTAREGTQRSTKGAGGAPHPVWLYVGFYESQRTGATYHSPKNCLPGSGWQFLSSERISVRVPRYDSIRINKVLVQKGVNEQVILYWYHDRGRVIANEYAAKAYLIWDAMSQNRTDGALVRISVPVRRNRQEAEEQALRFLRDVWDHLVEHLPQAETSPSVSITQPQLRATALP